MQVQDNQGLAKLEKVAELLDAYRAWRARRMSAFVSAFDRRRREKVSSDVGFNVFSLLGLEGDEVRHSRVLRWLLDETAEHGQGNLFARSFVEACRLDLPASVLERYRARCEYLVAEARTDVVLYRRAAFAVFVENKVFAEEGHDQTGREYRDLQRFGEAMKVPPGRRFAVFLTPDGRSPSGRDAHRWHAVSYGNLGAAFEGVLPQVNSDRTRSFLVDWLETVLAFGGETSGGDSSGGTGGDDGRQGPFQGPL